MQYQNKKQISSLYVCMAIKYIIVLFVEIPLKFITAKLSIRKPGSPSVLIICDLFNSHALFIYKSVVPTDQQITTDHDTFVYRVSQKKVLLFDS